jgi:hypothetical protein
LRLNQSESKKIESEEQLDCGKPVNHTFYDHLVGIANRHTHPNVPEPQTSLIFYQKSGKGTKRNDFDISAVEKRLLKAKREVRSTNKTLVKRKSNRPLYVETKVCAVVQPNRKLLAG